MKKIVLKFLGLSPDGKIQFGSVVVKRLTGNANFPTTNPDLAAITAVQNTFSTAVSDAKDGSKTAISIRNDKELDWDKAFEALAMDIQAKSGGDETKILSAGFEVAREKGSSQIPVAPKNVKLSTNNLSEALEISWAKSEGAMSYIVSKALGSPDGALPADTAYDAGEVVTRVKTVIQGLKKGAYYAFRVKAVGAAGQSPWSDVAAGFCL